MSSDVLFLVKKCWCCDNVPSYRRVEMPNDFPIVIIKCSKEGCKASPSVRGRNEHTTMRHWNYLQEVRGVDIADYILHSNSL